MLYTSLQLFYETSYVLHTRLKFSLEDILAMYPYERDIYLLMYKNEKEEEQRQLERVKRNGKLSF